MCLASDCGAFPRANGLGFGLGCGQCDALIQLCVISNFMLHAFTFGSTYHPQLAQMLERSFGLSHSDSRPNGISSLVNDFFTAQIQIFSTLMTMETIAAGEPRATGLPRVRDWENHTWRWSRQPLLLGQPRRRLACGCGMQRTIRKPRIPAPRPPTL